MQSTPSPNHIPTTPRGERGKILWRKGGIITKRDLMQQLKGFI
ncbi:hypothetical protein ACFPIK_06355 [Algoriphagus aquatilis]|uniref:Uncharacterized protein n=1 Tax=Algoriphagus aquatilis TaxID=490186 RepID=A0ABW0BU57_9BACT